MIFEDQIEQLHDYFSSLQERLQENSLFNSLSEKYFALSPRVQKMVLFLFVFLILFVILAGPISIYTESVQNMTSVSAQKKITQRVIQFNKNASKSAPAPKKFSSYQLKDTLRSLSQSRSIMMLPEQYKVDTSFKKVKTPVKNSEIQMFNIKNSQLNIKQAATLIYSLKKYNKSLFIKSIAFTSNREKPEYFDTEISIGNLFVKPISEVLPKPEPVSAKKSKRKKR